MPENSAGRNSAGAHASADNNHSKLSASDAILICFLAKSLLLASRGRREVQRALRTQSTAVALAAARQRRCQELLCIRNNQDDDLLGKKRKKIALDSPLGGKERS